MYGGIFVKKFTMSSNSKIAENKEYNCRDALKTDTVDFMIFLLKFKMIRCVHIQNSFYNNFCLVFH